MNPEAGAENEPDHSVVAAAAVDDEFQSERRSEAARESKSGLKTRQKRMATTTESSFTLRHAPYTYLHLRAHYVQTSRSRNQTENFTHTSGRGQGQSRSRGGARTPQQPATISIPAATQRSTSTSAPNLDLDLDLDHNLDEITLRHALNLALTQYLGLTGSSIAVDILKITKRDAFIRLDSLDVVAVVTSLSQWSGNISSTSNSVGASAPLLPSTSRSMSMSLNVVAKSTWLALLG